jgi:hypothetical protein
MTQQLAYAAFLENLGSTFRLEIEGCDPFELELFEVSDLQKTPQQEMFSVVFRCRAGSVLPQRIYRLEHEKMGQFDLFLVPIKKDDQGVHYEAVFNRLLESSDSSGSAS